MPWLPRDEEVEIIGAATHVSQDLDARGRHALFPDGRVARSDFPVPTHGAEGVDEKLDLGGEFVFDRRAVHEEESGGDPEGECEWWAELGEHVVRDDEFAEGGDILDCAVAALGGGVGGREDGGARGGVGG
ncbi:hypothetical protein O988_09459 [Pseudogymnoascus sp. VKM F-3808]|nr:hypothetical protein O988_09459 [Pseudogymnoascus sp. VKM F-3808]